MAISTLTKTRRRRSNLHKMDKKSWFTTAFKKRVFLLVLGENGAEEVDGFVVNVADDCVSVLPFGEKQEAVNLIHLDYAAVLRFQFQVVGPADSITFNPDFSPFDPDAPVQES